MSKKLFIINLFIVCCSILLFLLDIQEPIDQFIYNHFIFHDTLTYTFKNITILANASIIIILTMSIICYHLLQNKKKDAIEFSIFVSCSMITMHLLKLLFKRKRPSLYQLIDITGFSFPSGHAYASMIIYGYIIYLIRENLKGRTCRICEGILTLLIILIGISRVYLGVHYITDIIFGYSLGFISLLLFLKFKQKSIFKRDDRKNTKQ